jgi:hypothetical protein
MSKYSDFYNPLTPWHALSRPHLFAYKNLYELIFFHILNMRIKKTQNPSIFLATHWTLSLKSGDLDFVSFEIWRIWVIFSMKKTFV